MSKHLDALDTLLATFPALEAETERERASLDDLLLLGPTPLTEES